MLALLLGESTLATRENENNALGILLTLSRLGPEHTRAVVEIGIDHPGEMAVAAEMTRPEVAIMTGIAPVHVVHFGSLEALAGEKAILPEEVKATGGRLFFASACLDYAPFRALAEDATVLGPLEERERFSALPSSVGYGISEDAARLSLFSTREAAETYAIPPMSRGQAASLALALRVARAFGCPPELLQRRLRRWHPPAGRGEWKSCPLGRVYFDSYNANPVSLRDAVEFFHRGTPRGCRLWVLGGMRELGPYAEEAHRRLGERLPVRSGDGVLGIGPEMEAGLKALRERPEAEGIAIVYAATAAEGRDWVRSQRGTFFVKGSRHYALEQLFEGLWA